MKRFVIFLFILVAALIPSNVSETITSEKSDSNLTGTISHTIITFGASGDLAKKKVYPFYWQLFRDNLLPSNTIFYGYARSNLSVAELRAKFNPYMKVKTGEESRYDEFWHRNRYFIGDYKSSHDFELLNRELKTFENTTNANRLFYLAVPPSVFEAVTERIKTNCMAENGWNRVVVEKPFGKDGDSAKRLHDHLSKYFSDDQIYRMDHWNAMEMAQNLLYIRFANEIFSSTWNRESIAAVLITFKATFGAEGRGGYFDEYGMIRDVIQNHLMQLLALTAMEKPNSTHPEDIRYEKIKVLKNIDAIKLEDTVLGQYVGNPNGKGLIRLGYREDPTVPDDSLTATFALNVLHINNERWNGVPFILQSGFALDEDKIEIRIQYRDVSGNIFENTPERNELIINLIQGREEMNVKMMIKSPGNRFEVKSSELALTYATRYNGTKLPSSYERLIYDVINGSQKDFVSYDELNEAWRIFTPLLHEIESNQVSPIPYVYGSRGPQEAYDKCSENNFKFYKS